MSNQVISVSKLQDIVLDSLPDLMDTAELPNAEDRREGMANWLRNLFEFTVPQFAEAEALAQGRATPTTELPDPPEWHSQVPWHSEISVPACAQLPRQQLPLPGIPASTLTPDDIEFICKHLQVLETRMNSNFVQSISGQLRKKGRLSAKQIAAISGIFINTPIVQITEGSSALGLKFNWPTCTDLLNKQLTNP